MSGVAAETADHRGGAQPKVERRRVCRSLIGGCVMTMLRGSILQGVGDDVVTTLGAERAVAAGRGDDILLAVDLVAHRR